MGIVVWKAIEIWEELSGVVIIWGMKRHSNWGEASLNLLNK